MNGEKVLKGLLKASLGIALLGTLGFSKESIKIGALYNLTGAQSSLDTPSLRGAKLAAKLANNGGGASLTAEA